MIALLAKPTRATPAFNAGQKCWVRQRAGECSVRVVGRHRGRGRYIEGWLHEGHYSSMKPIEVDAAFFNRLGLIPADTVSMVQE